MTLSALVVVGVGGFVVTVFFCVVAVDVDVIVVVVVVVVGGVGGFVVSVFLSVLLSMLLLLAFAGSTCLHHVINIENKATRIEHNANTYEHSRERMIIVQKRIEINAELNARRMRVISSAVSYRFHIVFTSCPHGSDALRRQRADRPRVLIDLSSLYFIAFFPHT